mmetsp:Transcript_19174/g.31046  ORF Transcript_19174/g.31046 Transcript_19174/m.31046 type:complete len:80 (-) Transcript_19174:656-895(-)
MMNRTYHIRPFYGCLATLYLTVLLFVIIIYAICKPSFKRKFTVTNVVVAREGKQAFTASSAMHFVAHVGVDYDVGECSD